jgi:membrane-associated PAP2 superfamily phosphatase
MLSRNHGGMTPDETLRIPSPQSTPGKPFSLSLLAWTLLSLATLLAWDLSGADLALARLAGDAKGFALRDNWFMSQIAHDGAKKLSWLLVLGLCAGVWWPVGPLRRLPMARRIELALAPVLAGVLISSVKAFSLTSCPWDLQAFGGAARYLSHWRLIADGGTGHCFPGGHAANGFSMLAGYFVFRDIDRRLAQRWLGAALLAGLLLGLVQQWRGAHFMSHTLWTAWLCWVLLWALHTASRRVAR